MPIAQPVAMKAKFGLSLSTRAVLFGGGSLDDLLAMAEDAEASGAFHGVWVGDNLLSKPRVESIVTLSALATRTKRVKLGTVCMASFPLRDPILFALQWASLDLLSHGRTILAVCNGPSGHDGPQYAHELEVMGVPSRDRVGRLVEGVSLLRRLWSDEIVTHAGKFYRFREVDLQPKPAQKPVPVFLAVNPKGDNIDPELMERIYKRVATHGDGWQTDTTPVETFRERFKAIREQVDRLGKDADSFDGGLHQMVNINDDRDLAFDQATEYLASYYGAGGISRERAETWLAYGPPEAVIEKIAAYIEAGCTMPILRFAGPSPREQLQRCIEEVLPAFRA